MLANAVTYDAGYAAAGPSLRAEWQRVGGALRSTAGRLKTTTVARTHAIAHSKITKAFARAALGAGATAAFKFAVVGLTGTAGASAALGTLTAGTLITGYHAIKDYRAERQDRPQGIWAVIKDFCGFLVEHKWKYAKKLALSSGGAALAGAGLVDLFTHAAEAEGGITGIGEIVIADNNTDVPPLSEPVLEETCDEGAEIPETAEARLARLTDIAPETLNDRGQYVLEQAQKGQGWALNEMASRTLWGTGGFPQDQDAAIELYRLVQDIGNAGAVAKATQDLADIQEIFHIDTEPEPAKPGCTNASAPVADPAPTVTPAPPPEPAPVAQPEPPSARDKLAAFSPENLSGIPKDTLKHALEGRSWALQDAGLSFLKEGNGTPLDRALAVELLQAAQAAAEEKGNTTILAQTQANLEYIRAKWPEAFAQLVETPAEPQSGVPEAPQAPIICDSWDDKGTGDFRMECSVTDNMNVGESYRLSLPQAEVGIFYAPPLADLGLAPTDGSSITQAHSPCTLTPDPQATGRSLLSCTFSENTLFTPGTYFHGQTGIDFKPSAATLARAPANMQTLTLSVAR